MKFSTEPIVWIGVLVVVGQVIQSVLTGEGISVTLTDSLLTAVGALIGRKLVSPVGKTEVESA